MNKIAMASILDFLLDKKYYLPKIIEDAVVQDKEHLIYAICIIKNRKYLILEYNDNIFSYELSVIHKCVKQIINNIIRYEFIINTNITHSLTIPLHLEKLVCDALALKTDDECFLW